ncbi:MAG: hypothetical protein AMXMBFR7_22550 [Planctomycetota bacterium]
MNRPPRIALLSVRIGAGHFRAAEAVAEGLRRLEPEAQIDHLDAFRFFNPVFRASFMGFYTGMLRAAPGAWRSMYEAMELRPAGHWTHRFNAWFDRQHAGRLRAHLQRADYDAVVCTHYLPVEVCAHLRRAGKLRAPLHVVLTDFQIHTMWIQPGVDRYHVATPEMADALRTKAGPKPQIDATGIPILAAFGDESEPREALRLRLGLEPGRPVALVAGGGFGLGAGARLVETLAEAIPCTQWLCIAGTNRALLEDLNRAAIRFPGRIRTFGYVENMHELTRAADLAVTKCGGLTSSECLARGLPMVVVHPIPGQEERNADFLLECGVAVRPHGTAQLIFKVRELFQEPERLERMRFAARHAARPQAQDSIARAILGPTAAAAPVPTAPARLAATMAV